MRFKYNIKAVFRSKEFLFWNMAFPIIMGVIFHIAFGTIDVSLGTIPVAIVLAGDLSPIAAAFYDALPSFDGFLDATVTYQAYANTLLFEREVAGVFVLGQGIELMTNGGGISVSILETMANEFMAIASAMGNIATVNLESVVGAMAAIESYTTSLVPFRQLGATSLQNYFYVMLAVGCFMGVHMGLNTAEQLQPDMSLRGARVSIAPVSKIRLFFESLFSSVLVQFLMSVIIIAFYMFVLGVEFGTRLGLLVLACLVASAMSVAFGMFIASVTEGKVKTKRTIVMALTNIFLITAGMMSIAVRNVVRQHVFVVDRLNPVALISDTFVTLAIRENLQVYVQNMIIMAAATLVLIVVSGAIMARRKYANL